MDPKTAQLLSQLKDIQVPDPVGWWPLSQTLIGLFVGLGGILIGLSWYYLNQCKNNRYRQEALSAFNKALTAANTPQEKLQIANKLLKQVAITNYGRRTVANLSGQAWVDFLHNTALYINQPDSLQECLESIYRPSTSLSEAETQQTLAYAMQWIKGHHK
ncbi:DUF4381 domain-containing protein [Hydrogenovibrio sp. 3SP14C1]|uniref:DUF4381 domain-containing protein n=1 Tax=Hydrogenovibrio sp. 3SP14C1 TaxID=3038774 RepID=UPI0024177223|nr:DUF4381 domain-containing protein [Hydrogenovibrio sp. 3SP14C1]MDG4813546.1 DUF4381 domain-containing protein [Hydrogenovibrio sp. 3SP14C1]